MHRHKHVMGAQNLLRLCSFLLLLLAVINAEECEQKSGCECEFSDGTSINLHNLFKSNEDGGVFLYDEKNNNTIYYHGCVDVQFVLNIANVTKENCREAAAACVFNENTRNVDTLAHGSKGTFKFEHNIYTLSYSENGISTVVELVCTPDYNDDIFDIHDISKDGKQFTLALLSKHACRTNLPMGLSTGSKLLIMLFTFTLVYFIGGACLAYFIRGARGRELIPNVDFWMSLPGLVKDGFIFMISGCNTRLVTTAETYDQI